MAFTQGFLFSCLILIFNSNYAQSDERWTEDNIKTYLSNNEDRLWFEGIYQSTKCSELKFGLIRRNGTFYMYLLEGGSFYRDYGWVEGDLWGELIPTASKTYFLSKLKERTNKNLFYQEFDFEFYEGGAVRTYTKNNYKCEYRKVYPTAY
jgi:hypothetical protein